MKSKKPFNLIVISGRRWFQKSYGNTYHKAYIEIRHARKPTIHLESRETYGYGDQYLQTAHKLLVEAGYFADDYNAFRSFMMDNRDKFVYTVVDVPREKDL